ncbi:DEAD/DEAH box helicase [Candidatus Woesearchaeota archaeon]|nr:DEAD/DEAH box helicase [Candidatus Woesearchaeota archaeon]
MTFEELGLSPSTINALQECHITTPTHIQEQAIPAVLKGLDVIGMSKTGSGKTAAFGLPLLERINTKKGLQAIILAPTRELAVQICGELEKWSTTMGVRYATVYGGVSLDPQTRAMKKAHVIVATPGRLIDHMQRGNVDLSTISMFVLDEADKMVEMGFIEDVERILSQTSEKRQILLFGATISNEVDMIKSKYMTNPVTAKSDAHVDRGKLQQYYYNVKSNEKFSLLVHLLRKENCGNVIIFCSKRSTVDLLSDNLRKEGFKVHMIHGKLSQSRRLKVIDAFNKGKQSILIGSAVAARGLHIDSITHVFNYDLSSDPQEYVHRIGRTARAGQEGKAVTLLGPHDHDAFGDILHRYDVKVKELPKPQFKRLAFCVQQRGRGKPGRMQRGRRERRHEPRREQRPVRKERSRSENWVEEKTW